MTDMLLLLACYLLGSISGSLLLGHFRGIDIRKAGSGNAGGTNAFRTQGFKFALGTTPEGIEPTGCDAPAGLGNKLLLTPKNKFCA